MQFSVFKRPPRALAVPGIIGLALAACTSVPTGAAPAGASNQALPGGQANIVQPLVSSGPAAVTVVPSDHAGGVRLDAQIQVTTAAGDINSVAVQKTGTAQTLSGSFSEHRTIWDSQGVLDADASYTVKVTATGDSGTTSVTTSSFRTMGASRLTASASPGDGDVVGVGMPIKIRFNTAIPNAQKPGIIAHIAINSTPPQAGAWYWFSDFEVHYRPQNYWQSGTKVTVDARLKGVDAGYGVWGLGNWSEQFTVGPKHVSIIDAAAHSMTVYNNDQLIDTWPVSTGRPSLQTISGTLVVWYKTPDVLMDSLGLGIPRNSPNGYYEHVFQDVAISTDGFYIHSAPWSVWAQGYQNVSHGCVNLSPSRAATFYAFSQTGDVVVVKNTTRPASADDGEADWNIDFSKFQAGGQALVSSSAAAGTTVPARAL